MAVIEIEKQETKYLLQHRKTLDGDTNSITVTVNEAGTLTVTPYRLSNFVFENSNPERVGAVGELLIRASELTGEKK